MKTSNFILAKGKTAMALLFTFSVIAASCSKEENDITPSEPQDELMDIVTILENSEQYPELFTEQDDMLKNGGRSNYVYKRPPTFFNLTLALIKTDLLSTVARNQLTILAPSDEAFQKLFKELGVRGIWDIPAETLKPILLYHVISGKVFSSQLKNGFVQTLNGASVEVNLSNGVMFNDAKVIFANIRALNGVIHVIDKVLVPPSKNLVEIAQSLPDSFSTLVAAVIAADLAGVLSTGGPFTVFAPTNAAFEALFAERGITAQQLLSNKELLTKVLTYHVVEGRIFSSDLPLFPLSVKTLNGGSFTVDASKLKITDFNGRAAGLIPTLLNIQGTNGVIHVIDRVILPKL